MASGWGGITETLSVYLDFVESETLYEVAVMPGMFSCKREQEFYKRCRFPIATSGSYFLFERYLRSLVTHPEVVFGRKALLEIGAGQALYSRVIAEHFAPKRVVALDLVPEQLTGGNKIGRVAGVGGDCFYLPFRAKTFDVIFGSLILHRFRELEEVLAEIHRVLVNQGLYLGIEPSLTNPMHLYRQFFSNHSPNEFLLSGIRATNAFTQCGFQVKVQGLAPRFPLLRHLGLATCIGIWARKEE